MTGMPGGCRVTITLPVPTLDITRPRDPAQPGQPVPDTSALKKLPRFDFPEEFPESITTGNNFSDEHFINRLAKIESYLETPITKLMQHRGNLHNEKTYMQRLTHIPDNLYNKETYMDFNTLLCELLKKLSDALVELHKHQKEAKGELSVKNVKSL